MELLWNLIAEVAHILWTGVGAEAVGSYWCPKQAHSFTHSHSLTLTQTQNTNKHTQTHTYTYMIKTAQSNSDTDKHRIIGSYWCPKQAHSWTHFPIQITNTYTKTQTQTHIHKDTYTITQTHSDRDKHSHIGSHWAQNYFTTPSIFITDSWPEALSQILFSFQKQKHSSADKHFAAVHWLCSKAFLQASTFGPFSNPIEKHFQITFTRCSEEGIVWDVVVLEVSWLLVRPGGTRVWVGSTSTVAAAASPPPAFPHQTSPSTATCVLSRRLLQTRRLSQLHAEGNTAFWHTCGISGPPVYWHYLHRCS